MFNSDNTRIQINLDNIRLNNLDKIRIKTIRWINNRLSLPSHLSHFFLSPSHLCLLFIHRIVLPTSWCIC